MAGSHRDHRFLGALIFQRPKRQERCLAMCPDKPAIASEAVIHLTAY
ncbi:hypothetical protein [Streptomyces sp. NPDC056682]